MNQFKQKIFYNNKIASTNQNLLIYKNSLKKLNLKLFKLKIL